jgi:hypothetical protein
MLLLLLLYWFFLQATYANHRTVSYGIMMVREEGQSSFVGTRGFASTSKQGISSIDELGMRACLMRLSTSCHEENAAQSSYNANRNKVQQAMLDHHFYWGWNKEFSKKNLLRDNSFISQRKGQGCESSLVNE